MNCFKSKGWGGKRICKEFPSNNWTKSAVNRIIKNGRTLRKPGSGRPRAATSAKVKELLGLTESQEDKPGTALSVRKGASVVGLTKSTAARISKKYRKCVSRMRTPHVKPDAVVRRYQRAKNLYKRFNDDRIKKLVWQDEKLFTIQVEKNKRWDKFYIEK